MRIISFLGTGEYKQTTYFWNGLEHSTRFFPAAAASMLQPEEILVCATPAVRQHHNLPDLLAELERDAVRCSVIDILDGHSLEDLWHIFDAITSAVHPGEKVVFDVTHSFRSLPFLAFLAVAYLRTARSVEVEKVLYGAFEAGDRQTNRSPVFDLTPFVSLLDWTNATSRFVETGDGRPLAKLLRQGMPTGPQMGQDIALRALGKNLKLSAESIESVSQALQVTRPLEVMESSAQLVIALHQSLPAIGQRARPFAVLAEAVADQYGQFGLEDASEKVNYDENLQSQLRMITWYLEREQVVQAATLIREWVVSLLVYHFGRDMFDHKLGREPVEKALNNAIEKRRENPRPILTSPLDEQLEALPQVTELASTWGQVTDLRNDIAHVGMRLNPKTSASLKKKVNDLLPQLNGLAAVFLLNHAALS